MTEAHTRRGPQPPAHPSSSLGSFFKMQQFQVSSGQGSHWTISSQGEGSFCFLYTCVSHLIYLAPPSVVSRHCVKTLEGLIGAASWWNEVLAEPEA